MVGWWVGWRDGLWVGTAGGWRGRWRDGHPAIYRHDRNSFLCQYHVISPHMPIAVSCENYKMEVMQEQERLPVEHPRIGEHGAADQLFMFRDVDFICK